MSERVLTLVGMFVGVSFSGCLKVSGDSYRSGVSRCPIFPGRTPQFLGAPRLDFQ